MKPANFNIDTAVENWRKALLRYHSIDPEFAEELASGLHDRYEALIAEGYSSMEAFALAQKKTISDPSELSNEILKVSNGSNGLFGGMLYLLPNYLKIAWRNLGRKGFYNLINLISLIIGITSTLLAVMYITYETSFDSFLPDSERIYRMGQTFRSQDYSVVGFEDYHGTSPEKQQIQIDEIRKTQGVEDACQFYIFDQARLVQQRNDQLPISNVLQTNTPKSFMDIFNWEMIAGSKERFIENPNTILFTESEVLRFFGKNWSSDDVVDSSVVIDTLAYTIAGILKDVPKNSHLDFSMAIHQRKIQYWSARTYVKITDGAGPGLVKTNLENNIQKFNPRLAKSELFGGFTLDRVDDIHLNSNKLYEIKPPGDKRYLYIFAIISGIILLLTVSNYTNLSIAMSASRMREIGMRKIFGARAVGISRQFLVEAFLISLLSTPFVIVVLIMVLPKFNSFMGISLPVDFWSNLGFWIVLLSTILIVGFLSGLYPAIFLSRKKMLELFKGSIAKNTQKGFTVRKAIITFQFVLLVGLCSLTLFVNNQLRYINDKDLGYDKENVLYVNITDDWDTFTAFKNELINVSGINEVGSGSPMGIMPFNQTTYKLEGTDQVFDDAYNFYLDYPSLRLLGIQTNIEQYLDNPQQAPQEMVLINKTAANKFSSTFNIPKQDLVGRTIIEEPEYINEETGEVGYPFQIGGFFEDINVFSLKERVTPMFIRVYRETPAIYWASVGYNKNIQGTVLQRVENVFRKVKPNAAFIHSFLTQNVDELYSQEKKIGTLCVYFSLVAFFVAIIGLIALTAYLTALKRKEIGMRKVLGASTFDIIKQFNKEYISLLLIAMVMAAPLTYYGVSKWLSTFAYSIDIDIWIFLLSTGLTFLVMIISVSIMTYKVALEEPVKALQENQ